jgi:hypothetical protein|tara:strand:+ start:444 stop:776 length:333 start_codon:yes stop_codon:yes gene_type:complete
MTMRKDIEFGRGMAVPVAKKLDREGNEMCDESTKKAEVETDLAMDTFYMALAERGLKLTDPLLPIVEQWWLEGYISGWTRGLTRGANDTQKTALEALEAIRGNDEEASNR